MNEVKNVLSDCYLLYSSFHGYHSVLISYGQYFIALSDDPFRLSVSALL